MQSVSSRIWTRVAVSISYDDNHYTTSTSISKETLFVSEKQLDYFHILNILHTFFKKSNVKYETHSQKIEYSISLKLYW